MSCLNQAQQSWDLNALLRAVTSTILIHIIAAMQRKFAPWLAGNTTVARAQILERLSPRRQWRLKFVSSIYTSVYSLVLLANRFSKYVARFILFSDLFAFSIIGRTILSENSSPSNQFLIVFRQTLTPKTCSISLTICTRVIEVWFSRQVINRLMISVVFLSLDPPFFFGSFGFFISHSYVVRMLIPSVRATCYPAVFCYRRKLRKLVSDRLTTLRDTLCCVDIYWTAKFIFQKIM